MEVAAPLREADRDSHSWESRLYTESFEHLANTLLDRLRPRDLLACVEVWRAQRQSGQRLTRADVSELCDAYRADPDAVLPVFGYMRMALVNANDVVVGPGSPVDVLGNDKRVFVFVDPLTSLAAWLLIEAFDLNHIALLFHGQTIEKEH